VNLVIYRALGLGDLLTAVPALRALARAYPDHHRVLAAPRPLAGIAGLTGAIDEVAGTAPLGALPLRLHGADVAVNLHGRGAQSHKVLLAARPRRMIAFVHGGVWPREGDDGPRGGVRSRGGDGGPRAFAAPAWRPGEHEVVRWCRLLAESGIAADPEDLRIAPPPLPAPEEARGATLIHPGAASGARRWPAERWAAVARAELAAGRRVAVTGSAAERELATAVAAGAGLPERAVLAGRTSLLELAAAVAAAARVACGDTGIAHLATALGTPSVVLFGPTPPAEWGPPAAGPHIALWAGGRGDPHANAPDPGLLAIGADEVSAALGSG
jgi:ADP-heptose:LPS heptosyltransferase